MTVRTPERRTVAGLHTTIWPGTGANVLALSGLGSSGCSWGPLAGRLGDGHVVAPDLRGRGGSVGLTGPTGLRAHARDVAAVLDELDLTDVVVVGHSMGAYLAPLVAQEAGARIARLVLVDGGIRPSLPFFMRPAVVRAMFRKELRGNDREWPDVESFARRVKFDKMIAARPDLREPVLGILREELGGGAGPFRPRVNVDHAVDDAVDSFFGPDVEPALDALRVPTYVLLAENMKWAGQRPFISAKAVAPWLQRQPMLSVRRLQGNHLTILFAPEVATAITA